MRILPKSGKGFTLVELLVVIAIIAVLATVGITMFGNAQKNARDSKRKADLNAIAKAIEMKRAPGSVTYSYIAASDFMKNALPTNTYTSHAPKYCFLANTTTTPPANPTILAWRTGGVVAGALLTCPAVAAGSPRWTDISTVPTTVPGVYTAGPPVTYPATAKSWSICTVLEGGLSVYCVRSSQ